MTTQEQYTERLKEMVAAKFGNDILSAKECSALSEAIAEATGENIDHRLLELIYIAKRRNYTPRPAVLSTLARYVGYGDWSDFCSSREVLPAEDTDIIPPARRWGVIILTTAAILIVASTALYLLLGNKSANIEELCTPIKERYAAIATEECNALRLYANSADYNNIVAESIATSCERIRREAHAEIVAKAKSHRITLDDATLQTETTAIVNRCMDIYNCLYIEQLNK